MIRRYCAATIAAFLLLLSPGVYAAALPELTTPGGAVGDTFTEADGDVYILDIVIDAASGKYIWDELGGGLGPDTTDDLPEGTTNLYSTEARTLGTDVGDLPGSTVTTNATLETALGELEAGVEANVIDDTDDVAEGTANLYFTEQRVLDTDTGTFTGSTITDNATLKTALQELELAVEEGWTAEDLGSAVEALTTQADRKYRGIFVGAQSLTLNDGLQPGEVITISNSHSVTGDLTVDGVTFVEGTATPTTLTLVPGEVVRIQKETGGAYTVTARYGAPEVAVLPSGADTFSGTVDGDALLAGLTEYHFHAIFGPVSLTSTQTIGSAIDGGLLSQGIVEPLIIPNGTQGFITRNAVSGALTVHYNAAPDFSCSTLTVATPSLQWTISPTGVAGGATNFTFGGAGTTGGTAGLDRDLVDGRSGTRHVFNYEVSKNNPGGAEIILQFDVRQFGAIIAQEVVTAGDVLEAKTLEFYPTANYTINITDLSPNGSNRDGFVTNMSLSATCEGEAPASEIVSAQAGNRIVADANGSAFYSIPDPDNTSHTATTSQVDLIDYIAPVAGEYQALMCNKNFSAGQSHMTVGTTTGGSDIYDGSGDPTIFPLYAESASFTLAAGDNVFVSTVNTSPVYDEQVVYIGTPEYIQLQSALCDLAQSGDAGTVLAATTALLTTDGVSVDVGQFYTLYPDGTTSAHRGACEINEFIHDIKPFYVAMSHEGDSGGGVTVRVNGELANFTDLLNSSSPSQGVIAYGGGQNGNFNRRARVAGPVLQNIGDSVQFSGFNVLPFDGQIMSIGQNPRALAHTETTSTRLTLSRGGGGTSFNIRSADNVVQISGGHSGAYRIVRTGAGIRWERLIGTNDPLPVYEDPCVLRDLDFTEEIEYTATEFAANAVNTSGQPAGNGLFRIENGADALAANSFATYDPVTGQISGTAPAGYDLTLEASFITLGTGAATRVYHFRDVLGGAGTGAVSGTSGIFGQDSYEQPASVVVPAGTAFIYDVRSVSSGNNQVLQPGSTITATVETTEPEFFAAQLSEVTTATAADIDVIPDFSDLDKTFGELDGEYFTTLTDNAGTTEISDKALVFGAEAYVRVKYVRDAAATHGFYIRPNEPGTGRQAQARFHLGDGSVSLFNSGAGTTLPQLVQTDVEEKFITQLVYFPDTTGFDELEIAPAGTDLTLAPTVGATGTTSFVSVEVFDANPLPAGGTALTLLDDDTFATADDESAASAESIKAYVDAEVLTNTTAIGVNTTAIAAIQTNGSQEFTRTASFSAGILNDRAQTVYNFTGTAAANAQLSADTSSQGDGNTTSVLIKNNSGNGSVVSTQILASLTGGYSGPTSIDAGQALLISYAADGLSATGYLLLDAAPTGGGGGLAAVTSDATLTGDGTAGSPLSVVNSHQAVTTSGFAGLTVNGSQVVDLDVSTLATQASQTAQDALIATNTAKNSYPAADATKLAGIEAGATADQTGAELEAAIDTELGHDQWKVDNSAAITANTAKVGYTEAAVSANTDVAANTAARHDGAAQDTAIALNTAKVSADGSVNTHSDVDTATAAPTVGQVLEWDGTNWVPATVAGGGSSSSVLGVATETSLFMQHSIVGTGVQPTINTTGDTSDLFTGNIRNAANTVDGGHVDFTGAGGLSPGNNVKLIGFTMPTTPHDQLAGLTSTFAQTDAVIEVHLLVSRTDAATGNQNREIMAQLVLDDGTTETVIGTGAVFCELDDQREPIHITTVHDIAVGDVLTLRVGTRLNQQVEVWQYTVKVTR